MSIISRLLSIHDAFNALNLRTVHLHLQRSPGVPDATRGIQGVEYRVLAGGVEVGSGRTDANGRMVVRIRPGTVTTVRVLDSEYTISASRHAFLAVASTEGRKERLRYLGYQIGHGGPQGNGVDNDPDVFEYERSVLDFQANHGLTLDADETKIDAQLQNDAGA